MNKDLTLVIMAAGMGSRFGGLKQIEPIDENGNFIIDYSVYDAVEAGFNKIVFIIKEENYEIFKKTIGSRVEPHVNVEYAFQKNDNIPKGYNVPKNRTKPFGTGHALYCAKDYVNEKFAIISADDFFGKDSFKQVADFMNNNNDFCVVGYKIGETLSDTGAVKRGVCMEKDGYLSGIIESSVEQQSNMVHCTPLNGSKEYDVTLDHPVSMLMFGLTPIIFKELETELNKFFEKNKDNLETCEFLLPDVLDKMIKEETVKIKVLPTSSKWLGATYREDLPEIKEKIKLLHQNKIYTRELWK